MKKTDSKHIRSRCPKATLKGKVKKLKYEKSETPVDSKGLTFPDCFMAIMGWRRVK